MNIADQNTSQRRQPFIAALLSLMSVGVGHIYCGRIVLGAVLFSMWLWLLPLWFALAWMEPSTPAFLTLFVAPVFLLIATYFVSAVVCYRSAAAMPVEYAPKDYNHPLVYTALILVGLTYPLSVSVATRSFLWEAFLIPTQSMDPTLQPGDRVLCNRQRFEGRKPRRGDVVIFIPKHQPKLRWVKRVIGLSGDRVSIKDGQVSVNGATLQYDRKLTESKADYSETVDDVQYTISFLKAPADVDFDELTVPDGHVFVLGDQRDGSRDSRSIGSIAETQIIGRAEYRHTSSSLNRIGPFN